MANDSRAKREAKDEKGSKGKQINDKESTSSPSAAADQSCLRRSAREVKLKKTPNPLSSGKKRGRPKRKNIATTPVGKSDTIEKTKNGSPLRRSNRSKVISLGVPVGNKFSKSFDFSNMKMKAEEKERKEKSLNELVSEIEDDNKNKKIDEAMGTLSKEKTDARQYKEFCLKQEKGKNATDQDFLAEETSEDAGKVVLENIQDPISADRTPNGGIHDNDVSKKTGIVFFKRKRDTIGVVPDAPLVVGSKDTDTSVADAVISFPSDCKSRDSVEAHNTSLKKQRIEGNFKAGFTTSGGGKPNTDLPENGPLEDFQVNADVNLKGKDSPQLSSNDHTGNLKEKFPKQIAHESKAESSRFVEYWVPVQISSVQLEQYCASLLENSLSLCSPSRSDAVGARRNTLISTRKCCDHPYLVDQSLQDVFTKDLKPVEFLDVGIKASGKLQLLEAMLLETKKLGLRALLLFQSIGGSGRDALGDILEDFLGQRFGQDSYERLDSGLVYSKKQSVLNRFNKEKDKFVFLLETRACHSSIKLSAIGIVIMFNSDWNPMNDLRALQRISIDSEMEIVMTFRLYSSFTVEEKTLILAKEDKTLDSNTQSISPSTSQALLMWGASYLFDKLKEFHGGTSPALNTLDQSHLDCVLREFLTVLTQSRKGHDSSKLSLLVHAKHQATYRIDVPLFGELKVKVMNEDLPHAFWTKLLNDKHPRWRYVSNLSPKNRKRAPVQHFDYSQKKPEFESGELVKKHKKVGSDVVDFTSHKTGSVGQVAGRGKQEIAETRVPNDGATALVNDKIQSNHVSDSAHSEASRISKLPEVNLVECDERRKLLDSQQSLLAVLKPDVAKLSEVLHLPDNVRAVVGSFLEYIMNYHLIDREPETRLQAFQISLCWTSAALMKHKISHKDSLALAKQHLDFGCSKEESDYVYSLLQCLRKLFLYRTGSIGPEQLSAVSNQHGVNLGVDNLLKVSQSSEKRALSQSELALEYKLALADLQKSIKDIQTTCDKQMKSVILKQREEMEEFKRTYEEEKAQLVGKKKTEEAVVRLHRTALIRSETLKKLDDEYEMKIVELNKKMDVRLKNLEAAQVEIRNKVLQRKEMWVESVRSWVRKEFRLPECNTMIFPDHEEKYAVHEVSSSREQVPVGIMPDGVSGQDVPGSLRVLGSPEDRDFNTPMLNSTDSNGVPEIFVSANECKSDHSDEEIPSGASAKATSCQEQVLGKCSFNRADEEVPVKASHVFGQTGGHKNTSVTSPSPQNQKPDEAPSTVACREDSVNVSDGLQNALPMDISSSKEQVPEVPDSCMPEEVPSTDPETTAGDIEEGDKLSMRHSLNIIDGEAPGSTHEIVRSGGALDHVVSLDPSLTKEQIPNASAPCIPKSESDFDSMEEGGNTAGENDEIGDLPTEKSSSLPVGEVETSTSEVAVTRSDHGFQTEEENPDVASSSTTDREVSLLGLESALKKVALEGGSTNKKDDDNVHASSHEIVHQRDDLRNIDSSNPTIRENDREVAASGMSNQEASFLGSDSASSEVPGSGNANGGNDCVFQASSIPVIVSSNVDMRNDDSLNPPPSDDKSAVVGTCMPNSNKDFPQSERESETREVPEVCGNANTENSAAVEVDQQDRVVCSVSQEPQFREAPLANSLPSNQAIPSTRPEVQTRDAENIQTQRSSESERLPSHSTLNPTPNQTSTVPELGAQVQPSSTRVSPSCVNQSDTPLPSRVESSQPLSQAGLLSQPPRHVPEARTASTNNPLPPAPPAVSSYTLMPCHDPLQNEMERLNKEAEQTVKIHEETKLQITSDCDKEIEETIAQVRKKYDNKLKEAEAEFQLKKKQLDANHHKVLMNKILAEAFRLKVIDNSFAAMPPVTEMGSNFMQQLSQLSPEPTMQRPSPIPAPTANIMRSPSQPVAFSAAPPRAPPHNGNLQQQNPFRPSTSASPSTRVAPTQPSQGGPRIPAVGSQPGRAHISAQPNPSRLDLLINAANQSFVNPNNLPSGIGSNNVRPATSSNPPQPPGAAPDVVCLSDDD